MALRPVLLFDVAQDTLESPTEPELISILTSRIQRAARAARWTAVEKSQLGESDPWLGHHVQIHRGRLSARTEPIPGAYEADLGPVNDDTIIPDLIIFMQTTNPLRTAEVAVDLTIAVERAIGAVADLIQTIDELEADLRAALDRETDLRADVDSLRGLKVALAAELVRMAGPRTPRARSLAKLIGATTLALATG